MRNLPLFQLDNSVSEKYLAMKTAAFSHTHHTKPVSNKAYFGTLVEASAPGLFASDFDIRNTYLYMEDDESGILVKAFSNNYQGSDQTQPAGKLNSEY